MGVLKIKHIFLFFGIIFLDQVSKYIIRQTGGFYICNSNIAFGLEINGNIFWVIWLSVVILLVLAVHRYFIKDYLYIILILSGAVSNVIDRFQYGCIIDFIDLKFWPVFNMADIFITIGAIILIKRSLKIKF